jgi:hypothetical protein
VNLVPRTFESQARYWREKWEAIALRGGRFTVDDLAGVCGVLSRHAAAWKAFAKRLRAELKATNAWNVRLLDQAQQERDVYERSLSEAARELKARGERIAELELAAQKSYREINMMIESLFNQDVRAQETGNLLAIIHRDGGHYESKHGTQKATEDAKEIVYGLRARIDELTRERDDARIDPAAALAREASCKC